MKRTPMVTGTVNMSCPCGAKLEYNGPLPDLVAREFIGDHYSHTPDVI